MFFRRDSQVLPGVSRSGARRVVRNTEKAPIDARLLNTLALALANTVALGNTVALANTLAVAHANAVALAVALANAVANIGV
jgi:hypothetical protein